MQESGASKTDAIYLSYYPFDNMNFNSATGTIAHLFDFFYTFTSLF
jgi:hypothetical protein